MGIDAPFAEVRVEAGAARARVDPAHAARLAAGHFPGDPLLPGAALVGLMADVAGRLLPGVALVEVERCVFRTRVRPADAISIEAVVDTAAAVRATVRVDGRAAARALLRFAAPA